MEANSATELPNGVVQEGGAAATPGQPPAPVVAETPATPTDNPEIMEQGGQIKDWNWLEIGGFIILTTFALIAINYYRVRTWKTDQDIKQHDSKLSTLETEVQKLKTAA